MIKFSIFFTVTSQVTSSSYVLDQKTYSLFVCLIDCLFLFGWVFLFYYLLETLACTRTQIACLKAAKTIDGFIELNKLFYVYFSQMAFRHQIQ